MDYVHEGQKENKTFKKLQSVLPQLISLSADVKEYFYSPTSILISLIYVVEMTKSGEKSSFHTVKKMDNAEKETLKRSRAI